jgi:hypothetical protein
VALLRCWSRPAPRFLPRSIIDLIDADPARRKLDNRRPVAGLVLTLDRAEGSPLLGCYLLK